MEEGALLGGMSSPEEAMVPDLFGADGGFVSENMPLKAAAVVGAEEEEFHVLKDPYLSAAGPKGPLLHAFNPPLSGDCKTKVKAELLVEESEEEMLGEFPRLPDLDPLEDPVLPAAPPPQPYNVHFLSPMRTAHGSPAIVPLGAWAREGAAHAGVRVIPVEVKEGGGASEIPEEAALQNPLCPEARVFRSSQEAEGASGASHQDTGPVVLCQLRGGAPVLRLDGSGAAGLQALHWAPRGQDPGESPQADGPRPVTALVGRLLPVPAKLNLITQLGEAACASAANGPAFPAGPALGVPPKPAVAGCCDCLAAGDCGSRCSGCNCRNSLCLGTERLKAIKATVMCSSVCKCVGCRSYPESPERRAPAAVPACAETGGAEGGRPPCRAERRSSCISWEVVEATCACLLAQGEEAERAQRPEGLAQQMILEEFGRCLSQILHTEFKSKGLTME
ncbi:testis expressed metallothionein like protein [Phyllostomus discolor]|uniref:Testis expressed metallothionein like protein n=1 Tax=Phyllostomus discolor TaxID=89673 RepID=A0A834A8X4_9CHIR|nr:testis expressed metallothionein like protein [Phyllostomus discolor]